MPARASRARRRGVAQRFGSACAVDASPSGLERDLGRRAHAACSRAAFPVFGSVGDARRVSRRSSSAPG